MKQLKICMITTFYPPYHPGGCGLHVYHLANLLAEDGHQVEVICSGDAHTKIEKQEINSGRGGRPSVDFFL